MDRTSKESASLATAAAIRRDVMRIGADGAFLGSEDELLERYGVSRPTLRQAARIVEHEQLITVRRGVNGGVFTRIPTSEAVARVASVFLQLNGTGTGDLLRAVTAIAPAIALMACAAPDDAREAYADWVAEQVPRVPSMRRRAFIEHVAENSRRMAELAACPPLLLFQNVLMELTLAEARVNVFADRDRMTVAADYQEKLAEAIRRGDRARAHRLASANESQMSEWLASAPGYQRRES